jgi:transposase
MFAKTSRFSTCPGCLQKQLEIDRLREENVRLKARLRHQERTAQEGPFGSSTPSAKVPVKPNASVEQEPRAGGAQDGHPGHGRRAVPPAQAQRVERVEGPARCSKCGGPLEDKGIQARSVIDLEPLRRQTVRYQLKQKYCPRCRRRVAARAPGVLGRNLLSNRLLAHVAVEHHVQGVTLGRLEHQLQVGYGTLVGALHQLARRLEPVCPKLVAEFRRAALKQADETGWRTDGHNGYAWLFCTENLSLFRFRQSRSAAVAHQVLGQRPLPGVLVVDRCHGYNRAPCRLQYCYAHLLRDVQDLEKEFPDHAEVQRFVGELAPLLARAMHLPEFKLSRAEYLKLARQTRLEIMLATQAPAQHPGIQRIQNLYREKASRLYHWARDPKIPAHNNYSERELRPLVIARKISFGSQSEAGAHTREVLMSVLHTLRKRTPDVALAFQHALDRLAENPTRNPYTVLYRFDSS